MAWRRASRQRHTKNRAARDDIERFANFAGEQIGNLPRCLDEVEVSLPRLGHVAQQPLIEVALSDYLRLELERSADQLTTEELRARLAAMSRTTVEESPADGVRAERDSA